MTYIFFRLPRQTQFLADFLVNILVDFSYLTGCPKDSLKEVLKSNKNWTSKFFDFTKLFIFEILFCFNIRKTTKIG